MARLCHEVLNVVFGANLLAQEIDIRVMYDDAQVHRNIKPQILSSFGDLALAIGDKFEPYLPHVLTMLSSAQVQRLLMTI